MLRSITNAPYAQIQTYFGFSVKISQICIRILVIQVSAFRTSVTDTEFLSILSFDYNVVTFLDGEAQESLLLQYEVGVNFKFSDGEMWRGWRNIA